MLTQALARCQQLPQAERASCRQGAYAVEQALQQQKKMAQERGAQISQDFRTGKWWTAMPDQVTSELAKAFAPLRQGWRPEWGRRATVPVFCPINLEVERQNTLGDLYARLDRKDEAREAYGQAWHYTAFTLGGVPRAERFQDHHLPPSEEEATRQQAQRAGLPAYPKSETSCFPGHDPLSMGQRDPARLWRAHVDLTLERLPKALEAYQMVEKDLPIELQAMALHGIATVYEKQGRLPEALQWYRTAIDAVEKVQGAIRLDTLVAGFASAQAPLYEHVIQLLATRQDTAGSFAYAERARGRAFLNQLGNRKLAVHTAAPEAHTQMDRLRSQLTILENRPGDCPSTSPLQGAGLLPGTGTLPPEPACLSRRQQRDQKYQEYAEALGRLKQTHPAYASLLSVDTVSLAEVQRNLLDEQTTLISYFVTTEQTLAWVIDRQQAQMFTLPVTREQLRLAVGGLRDTLTQRQGQGPLPHAIELYTQLVAPLQAAIRHTNLVIVPHGPLHYLPFSALWNSARQRYLLQEYALTLVPSASVLRFIRPKQKPVTPQVLVFGNPDNSLPHAADEARAIAALYQTQAWVGVDATETRFAQMARGSHILHLAAHGVYEQTRPLFSAIELKADAQSDGKLEVHELYSLDLSAAHLVVLSACQTALGKQSTGDEIVGLTRAFLAAGTPSVVSTLWAVDDAATAALMTHFYRQLQQHQTTAGALRAAQVELLEDPQQPWRAPYFWAAFTLTGDARGAW